MPSELIPDRSPAELRDDIARARAARERLRGRPLAATIDALAAAAERWQEDVELAAGLPAEAALSPAMVDAVLPLAAAALDGDAMAQLVERELGPGAPDRPAPDGPPLVAHVLASNVPALALPAIALGCLAGAAVLVKSGRHDRLSAPAFRRALAAVDAELAATVVTSYWPGGSGSHEDAAVAAAEVVVLTGGDAALATLARRVRGRLIAHGPRMSVAAVASAALAETDPLAAAIALDVALYEQRGCLSPHVVFVETGGAITPRDLARRLAAALDALARRLPAPSGSIGERAAVRVLRGAAEWAPGAEVFAGPGGTVVYEESAVARAGPGGRTIRVHPVATLDDIAALLPAGEVECVGLADTAPERLAAGLRARGVSRCCPPGRMQRPRLGWPRGQQAPLGALLGRPASPQLEVERV
jgi:hypothetical protein